MSTLLALPAPIDADVVDAEIIEVSTCAQIAHVPAAPDFPDIIGLLLNDKRSPETRRAYESDLAHFFKFSQKYTNDFLAQPTPAIALDLANYKTYMRGTGLAEATINRRLAAVKSLLKFANRLGLCATDGRNVVDGEKVRHYRDTRGIDVKTMKKLLKAPTQLYGTSLRGLRDTAILGLLWENALRRAELCKLDEDDLDVMRRELSILGKGRGSQKDKVTLSFSLTEAIYNYLLEKRKKPSIEKNGEDEKNTSLVTLPLFANCDRRPDHAGKRLTPDGLYQLVGFYGREIGLKRLTPHQLRHSAVTAALDATKGDVRKVQKLSRHAKIETLMIYDDNRQNMQEEVSSLLAGLTKK